MQKKHFSFNTVVLTLCGLVTIYGFFHSSIVNANDNDFKFIDKCFEQDEEGGNKDIFANQEVTDDLWQQCFDNFSHNWRSGYYTFARVEEGTYAFDKKMFPSESYATYCRNGFERKVKFVASMMTFVRDEREVVIPEDFNMPHTRVMTGNATLSRVKGSSGYLKMFVVYTNDLRNKGAVFQTIGCLITSEKGLQFKDVSHSCDLCEQTVCRNIRRYFWEITPVYGMYGINTKDYKNKYLIFIDTSCEHYQVVLYAEKEKCN